MYKRAAEEDVEAQRQELMAGFDDALRKREHEFRKKADDLSNATLASELKVSSVQSTVLCQWAEMKLYYLPFKEACHHDYGTFPLSFNVTLLCSFPIMLYTLAV